MFVKEFVRFLIGVTVLSLFIGLGHYFEPPIRYFFNFAAGATFGVGWWVSKLTSYEDLL